MPLTAAIEEQREHDAQHDHGNHKPADGRAEELRAGAQYMGHRREKATPIELHMWGQPEPGQHGGPRRHIAPGFASESVRQGMIRTVPRDCSLSMRPCSSSKIMVGCGAILSAAGKTKVLKDVSCGSGSAAGEPQS